ncbi:putative tam domain methyltransferase protein [Neofusicoccum parvum UCRNP2]|uniref:Putative tam domain methyltransferase protein n=1 Tax=Botryosphaeria parva (strain UCR-NP2) TaxID=1287680 RepID=R1GF06_BOTPV|nr:putative tam domain methyltransferase protein [Neofusicoccum parvum UCRNP2]
MAAPNDNETSSLTSAESAIYSDLSASVTSSILQGRFENGRRYHAHREGTYLLPEDEKEQDRLDLMGHCFNLVLKGDLHKAPLGANPQLCLDIGTGTGMWALDFADKYPACEVIGTDLSAIQPSWTSPNCKFIIDDANADWLFANQKGHFDFIHARYLYPGGIEDWDKLWRQAFDHLRPGGWVEHQEPTSMFFAADPAFEAVKGESQAWYWQECVNEASKKIGRKFNIAHEQKERMVKAGFVNVELGKVALLNVLEGIRPTCLAIFTRVLGWDLVRSEALTAAVLKEFLTSKYKLSFKLYFTYGQKPMSVAS